MNYHIIFLVTITIVTSNVKGKCPSEEPPYKSSSCKVTDDVGQDLFCTCSRISVNVKDSFDHDCQYLDCLDALIKGQYKSGVYLLRPDYLKPFKAYCDMETDGGGWTVIQRRMDGSVDFYRNRIDYDEGFGNISGEYWLGLSKLHRLANGSVPTQLRVDMRDKEGKRAYASYSTFYIGSSTTDYTLHVSGYGGTVGDALTYHNLKKFTTKDKDNDHHNDRNCAIWHSSGWWYKDCYNSNLNGHYGNNNDTGIIWYPWKGWHYSLPFVEMKVRRVY